ncbi:DMT family transporter [Hippea sp. KM1]|uniref:DMT family transporter n=1 Tax=Hippea sp. KM1 TaxID=944481 RepID=UPI00046CEC34|nr:DMT family transporter [Hippea sp. KM1]
MEKILKGSLFSVLSAASFASLVVLVKIGYNSGLSTLNMLLLRFGFAVLLMGGFFFIFKRNLLKAEKSTLKKAFFTGSILYTAQAFSFFSGVKYTSPNVVELVLYLYPAAVSILSHFFFKDKLNLFKLFYIAVILSGFGFIFQEAFYSKLNLLGILFSVLAMSIYSFYLISIEFFVRDENAITFSFYTIVFAFLSFFVINLFTGLPQLNANRLFIGALLGLIPTFMAIMFLFMAIENIGSALTSVFSSIEPLITIALSYIALGITLTENQLIGGALIIIGVFLANAYHLKRSSDV